MKALTVQQPWAGLIVLGAKTCETRSWNTKYRGDLAIHSSAKMSKEGLKLIEELVKTNPDKFKKGNIYYQAITDLGKIIGQVTLSETFSTNETKPQSEFELEVGDYSPDRWFWWLNNPVRFSEPIPAKGQLSLWNWERNQ